RDITKEKKLEEESKRRERLSAMGEIAVTLAHEIRNPLGSIELFAGLLKRNLEGENKRLAEAIISVSRSINKTVTDILLFTKSIDIQKEKVSIAEIVDDVIESLRHLISKKSAVVVVRGSRELSLQGSRELLKVCITNIITNALEAIDEKGRVEIEWEGDENYVTIIFRDDGIGIPENLKEEIFKPFFTTKRAGTGIGLAVVSRIVEAHGGTIEFTSKPGETEFRLKFSVS
ncbi:MAG: sensor histidine kinase, partial [Thermosulfidibacteraceae bacterium]